MEESGASPVSCSVCNRSSEMFPCINVFICHYPDVLCSILASSNTGRQCSRGEEKRQNKNIQALLPRCSNVCTQLLKGCSDFSLKFFITHTHTHIHTEEDNSTLGILIRVNFRMKLMTLKYTLT